MNKRDKRLLESWKRDGFKARKRAKPSDDPQIILEKVCPGGLTIRRTWIPGHLFGDVHVWDFVQLGAVVKELGGAVDAMVSLRKRLGHLWSIWVNEKNLLETDANMGAALRTMKNAAARRPFDSMREATNAERKARDIEQNYAPMIEAIRVHHGGRWHYNIHAAGEGENKTASRENRRLISELAILLDDAWAYRFPPLGPKPGSRTLLEHECKRVCALRKEGKGNSEIERILFPEQINLPLTDARRIEHEKLRSSRLAQVRRVVCPLADR